MSLSIAPSLSELSLAPQTEFVLIVDDHEPTRRNIKALIELNGYLCVSLSSAADALIFCDEHRPTVVVTDFSMPGLNGEGLARWLKARYPTTPILLLTGEDFDSLAISKLKTTFTAVIGKPLQIESFLEILKRLMSAARGLNTS